MLNKIIQYSLNNRLTVLVVTGLLMCLGVVMLLRTQVDIFPDLNAPTVVIMTEAPGMAPEEVEKIVTFPIETTVNGATGVRRVRSTSTTGFSVVWVEFDWDTDIYRARQIVSERLAGIDDRLPQGVSTPVLGPQSSILGEMMIIGLTSDSTSLQDLRTIADRTISPRLLAMGGVSQVAVIGGDVKQYQIKLSPSKMQYFGITLNDVLEATENINSNSQGGVIYQYGNEYIVKGEITTTDPEQLSRCTITTDPRSGMSITLADIATVETGPQQPRLGVASVNAHPAVLITVSKQPAASTLDLTDAIDAELIELAKTMPHDIQISTDIFRQADFIDNSISNLQKALLEGALFVIIVMFFFLMNARTTAISLIALPVSIVITVIVLHLLGYTINTMSLGGIAIAIGSLVDDAIVDVENVYKRLRNNHLLPPEERLSTLRVIFNASAEVRMPIFNSSLIIIAGFLPLFFLSGIEGRMLIPLGVAFIVALIASTITALTLTPVLCSFLLGSKKATAKLAKEPATARLLRLGYERILAWALAHKRSVIISTCLLFLLAAGLFFTLGRSFLPPFNEGSFTINVSTLPGISLDESDKVGRVAEELILSVPEVNKVARKTGRAELDEHSLGVNVSEIEAPYTLTNRSRGEVVKELRQKLATIPGANIEIGQPISHRIDAMMSGTQAQIAIKIFGDNIDQLFATGKQIKELVSDIDGVVDVNIEQQMQRPQLDIRPNRDLMAEYGVKMTDFSRALSTMLTGVTVSQVYEDGMPYDVVVIAEEGSRNTIEDIQQLTIDSNRGPIPLSTVADVVSSSGPNTINRENVKRRLVISANVEDGYDLRGTVNKIQRSVNDNITLPENFYVTYGGQFESEASASRTLLLASLGALLLIFMLLYQQFKNVTQSLIILINMPLAMIGGVLILVILNAQCNIPAIIGFISLMGITTRNGMLLMSRYNTLAEQGVELTERIFIGSSERLMPIILTALTSALALIPLAVGAGKPGNEIQSPLAIVILGGLISSTLLNVVVVPVLYYLTCKNKKQ